MLLPPLFFRKRHVLKVGRDRRCRYIPIEASWIGDWKVVKIEYISVNEKEVLIRVSKVE
jgi:hypothetical protein